MMATLQPSGRSVRSANVVSAQALALGADFAGVRSGAVGFWIGTIAVLCLYFKVVTIGTYTVTVGSVLSIFLLIYSLRLMVLSPFVMGSLGFVVLWPVTVEAFSTLMGATLDPGVPEFLQSYGLWLVSMLVVTMSVVTRSPMILRNAFWLGVIILGVAAIQVLLATFGSAAGYTPVASAMGIDYYSSYARPVMNSSARAWGLYYEPSMCGRVVMTLAFIDFLLTRKLLRNAIMLVVALVLTKSLGLAVVAFMLGSCLFSTSFRQVLIFTLGSLVAAALVGSVLEARLSKGRANETTSTERRTILPARSVMWGFKNYPVGIPIGSMAQFASVTGYTAATGEAKITNGFYEAVSYFGLFAILIVLGAAAAALRFMLVGERELAIVILNLLTATAQSGSFLSIESSLLIYFFTVAALYSRRRRRLAGEVGAYTNLH